MITEYVFTKSGEIIVRNGLLIGIVFLIFFSLEKLFNFTFSLGYVVLGAICYCIIAELFKYRKWLHIKST